jgi:hypothetical protein
LPYIHIIAGTARLAIVQLTDFSFRCVGLAAYVSVRICVRVVCLLALIPSAGSAKRGIPISTDGGMNEANKALFNAMPVVGSIDQIVAPLLVARELAQ